MNTQTNGAGKTIDLDPNRNWDVCPVIQAKEELDEEVDVLRSQFVAMTRLGLVREGYFIVLRRGQKPGSGRCAKWIRTT